MFEKGHSNKRIVIRDSTLREGLDVPDVHFSFEQKLNIATLMDQAKVPEIEVVAPGKVFQDLEFVKKLKARGLSTRTSGLVYSFNSNAREEIKEASKYLNRFDLLMPVSPKRKPYDPKEKMNQLIEILSFSLHYSTEIGVGFPHAAQTDIEFLQSISSEAVKRGAKRVTLYDTNGSLDPFEVYHLVKRLKENLETFLFFHGHNDLGMATANSLAAVYAGADGLDVTVNGLGDRAGNASLEQVVLSLHLKGFETGIILKDLKSLSESVEKATGLRVSELAPVVGKHIFVHKSPGHLESPDLFEAFDPQLVGSKRELTTK
jgi:isopropylmalate/homocitrate/citramalate synthase